MPANGRRGLTRRLKG